MNCMVTGAFSYTGRFIAKELISRGATVRTLTNHPRPEDPLYNLVKSFPLNFTDFDELTETLSGTDVLFNTYWVRFPQRSITYELAIRNTIILLNAAQKAGVKNIVHISVTNPDKGYDLPYYHGKLQTETIVSRSSLPYSIIRPSLIFGPREILLHNIAWLLRNFPVFAIPGNGEYLLQPVSGEDVARLSADAAEHGNNEIFDAVGPEVFSYNELIELIARALGKRPKLVHMHPKMAVLAASIIGKVFVRDTIITEDEIGGLMANLLVSENLPLGHDSFTEWLHKNSNTLGTEYTSEFQRHFR